MRMPCPPPGVRLQLADAYMWGLDGVADDLASKKKGGELLEVAAKEEKDCEAMCAMAMVEKSQKKNLSTRNFT